MNIGRQGRGGTRCIRHMYPPPVRPAVPLARHWDNRPVRWRMILLLLGAPTLLTVGLVLLIRAGRSDVHDRVSRNPASGAATQCANPALRGVRLSRIGQFDTPICV